MSAWHRFTREHVEEQQQRVSSTNADADTTSSTTSDLIHVSMPFLLLSTAPFLCLTLLSWKLGFQLESPMVVGLLRTFIQLSVLGAILHPIFVWGVQLWWVVILYVLFMITLAALEASGKPKYYFSGLFELVLASILCVVGVVSIFAFGVILRPDPLWSPQYVIPIIGMLLGNCINGVALSLNSVLTSLKEQSHEMEVFMSFGASPAEASARLVREAVRIGAMPMLNSMAVIGLISIPGMMTGQILGGSPPMEAAFYQILIIVLIATTTLATILVLVSIVVRSVAFGEDQSLRTDRFLERPAKLNFLDRLASCWNSFRLGFYLLHRKLQKHKRRLSRWGMARFSSSTASNRSSRSSSFGNISSSFFSSEVQPLKAAAMAAAAEANEYYVAPKGKLEIVTLKHADLSTIHPHSHLEIRNVSRSIVPASSNTIGSHHEMDNPDSPNNKRTLFQNLNFEIHSGDIVAVSGPSGVGKSQLLRLIAGLTPMDQPVEEEEEEEVVDGNGAMGVVAGDSRASFASQRGCGDVLLAGRSRSNDFPNLAHWRRQVRYVSQYKIDLPGTPREFVEKVTSFSSWRSQDSSSLSSTNFRQSQQSSSTSSHSKGKSESALDSNSSAARRSLHLSQTSMQQEMMTLCLQFVQKWGLDAGCMDTQWKSLSGGESQRVYVAIALASRPRCLLLDESTSALDMDSKLRVEESVRKAASDWGMSVLWITHDTEQLTRMTEQTVASNFWDQRLKDVTKSPLSSSSSIQVSRATI